MLQAFAATGSGRAATRFGDRSVLVVGLLLLLAGLLTLTAVDIVDPQRAREVVEGATASMVDAIHTLSLIMTAVPVAAIVLALILLRPQTEQEL